MEGGISHGSLKYDLSTALTKGALRPPGKDCQTSVDEGERGEGVVLGGVRSGRRERRQRKELRTADTRVASVGEELMNEIRLRCCRAAKAS